MMKYSTLIAVTPLLLLLATGTGHAHAVLDHAEPQAGSKVAAPPREVALWFTQKLEAAFSRLTVTDAAGQRLDSGKPQVAGNHMSISLRPGSTGTYHVNWRVLSVDSHPVEGSFTFQVGQ